MTDLLERLFERLTRERDEARAKAIMDRQAQHAIELALVAERDEARAEVNLAWTRLNVTEAERDEALEAARWQATQAELAARLSRDHERERDEAAQAHVRVVAALEACQRERDEARALLVKLQWDKAGYCPLCFPGEAPYRHTED